MERPENVPQEAEWSDEDNEWVLGTRDDDGEYHGEVHYWRPDGTLVSIANQHHGKWHGECRRFHENGEPSQIDHYEFGVLHGLRTWIACDEPTTEVMHTPQMSEDIWRAEVLYDAGRPTRFQWFLRDGTEVDMDGSPAARAPAGVPEGAILNKKNGHWVLGTWDGDGKRDGELRVYRPDGTLLSVENYVGNVPHGPHETFYEDGTKAMSRRMEDGSVSGEVEFYFRNGQLARAGVIRDGVWDGVLADYAPDGSAFAAAPIPPPRSVPELAPLADDESAFIEELVHGDDPDEIELSPQGLARLIAIAFGGTDERDGARARAARSHVRAHPSLQEVLPTLGLDTAPRLITAGRLERLCAACNASEAVDGDALRAYFVVEGGVGQSAALSEGRLDAVRVLRDRASNGRLQLQYMALEEVPLAVRYLIGVTDLDLSYNSLGELPSWIAELVFLNRLKLSDNCLHSLPSELTRLRDLRSLHLSDNGLESVPTAVLELEELTVLNLGDNEIREVPAAFGDLPRLRELWLHGNPLSSLPTTFGQLPLTFLHLGDVPWSEPPDCLWELETLETLWIASPTLKRLPPDVARLPNLTELMVWYSSLEEVPDELFEMTQLEELRIGHNPLPDGTIDLLKEALPDCKVY